MLVVPARPGPLVDLQAALEPRRNDEIDAAIDEIFGPDPDATPGWLDAGLLAVGIALIVWSAVSLHSPLVYVAGAVAAALGVILPLRSAVRRMRRRKADRRRAALTSGGFTLEVGHPETRKLAMAYDSLMRAAALTHVPLAAEARSAAHTALVETAVLLGGEPPSSAAETEYVAKRVEAIGALAAALEQQNERALLEETEEAGTERAARRLAGAELDEIGMSSLTELQTLTELMSERDDERSR